MGKARVMFTGSSTDAIYRAEPVVGRGARGCCPPQRLPGAGRMLRWAAPLAALLLALAIVLYFITADMPSGALTDGGRSDARGHPWASDDDGGGGHAVTDDDVVSLDGDVILDLGDVTYHEGQFHGGGRVQAKKKPQQRQESASTEEKAAGEGGEDFMEIVPAPDLGPSPSSSDAHPTESVQEAEAEPPAATEHDAAADFLFATSQLLAKLKASEAQVSTAVTLQVSSETATKRSPAPPAPTAPATAAIVSATAPTAVPAAARTAAPPPHLNDSNDALCFSPRLPLCRGVLPYDLTTLPLVPGVRRLRDLDAALPYFDMVVESGCSARARQFVCSLLEPACQPAGAGPLLPCRKACKAVAEECSDFVLATLDLSRVFQCERYPDLEDSTQCVNFARGDVCLRGEFRCPDGSCVPGRWRCDGARDCAGGADERLCHATCSADEFRCEGDRKCIPLRWRCDAQRDCADASDEIGCPPAKDTGCAPGHFQCADQSACVPDRWLCDGLTHCPDGSDERNCSGLHCHAGDFQCRHTKQCIPAQWRCNGVNDCADNSDEDHCTAIHAAPSHTSPCPVGELRCLDGRCISVQQLCDGHRDCGDGADEVNCGGGDDAP